MKIILNQEINYSDFTYYFKIKKAGENVLLPLVIY